MPKSTLDEAFSLVVQVMVAPLSEGVLLTEVIFGAEVSGVKLKLKLSRVGVLVEVPVNEY